MKMELPTPVLHSLFALNKAGYEAYVVGGCVRDALMGIAPFDWDITTSATPEQTLSVFSEHRTIETGIKHGTVTVIMNETPLEITTYRVDGDYTDSRHPDAVTFTRSLTKDLQRRDFTVNALAYHPHAGLVDAFGGQNDLHSKIIRCVGDPQTRFQEDALRILRGLRFASTLDFAIEPATAQAIHQLAPTLSHVSAERITTELGKLLCGANVQQILTDYADVLNEILPYPIPFSHLAHYVAQAKATPTSRYGTLLFKTSPETVTLLAKNLKFSRRFTEDLVSLIENKAIQISQKDSILLRLLHQLGPSLSHTLVEIRSIYEQADYSALHTRIDQLVAEGACYKLSDLAVKGTDLVNCGITPGPQVGTTLNYLLDAVIDGLCTNTKEELLILAKEKSLC